MARRTPPPPRCSGVTRRIAAFSTKRSMAYPYRIPPRRTNDRDRSKDPDSVFNFYKPVLALSSQERTHN